MVARPNVEEDRVALRLAMELSPGRHGASARVELRSRPAGRVALFTLHGSLDAPAVARLRRVLDDLAGRGLEQLLLDCSQVRHIDYRAVPALAGALTRFESRAGFVVCGLSSYLRDLFRLAGCEDLRCWPSSAELLAVPAGFTSGRECAS